VGIFLQIGMTSWLLYLYFVLLLWRVKSWFASLSVSLFLFFHIESFWALCVSHEGSEMKGNGAMHLSHRGPTEASIAPRSRVKGVMKIAKNKAISERQRTYLFFFVRLKHILLHISLPFSSCKYPPPVAVPCLCLSIDLPPLISSIYV
jgi:hypothetical protein